MSNIDAQETTQWKLPEGAKARLGKGVITDMQLSPDGTNLAIASSTGVRLYDMNTGEENVILRKNNDLVGLLTFSPDGTTLVHTSGEKKCYVWNVENWKHLKTFTINESSIKSLKLLEDEKTLVILNWNATFSFWDISTGDLLETTHLKASKIRIKGNNWHRARDAVFNHHKSPIYAIGNHDGSISIQDGRTNQLIRTLVPQTNEDAFLLVGQEQEQPIIHILPPGEKNEEEKKHSPSNFRDDGKPFPIQYSLDRQNISRADFEKQPLKWIMELKFSPDGKLLVSKSSYKIPKWDGSSGTSGPTELWDVETGEQLAALPWWVDVEFSSDSNTVALLTDRGFHSGNCDIWDLIDYHEIAHFESIAEVRFSLDGGTLLLNKGGSYDGNGNVIEEGKYTIWDIATQTEINSLIPDDNVMVTHPKKLLLSKDGSTLVTADQLGEIDIWKTKSERHFKTLTIGYSKEFTALGFSDDGQMLASGSSTFLHIWDTEKCTQRNKIKIEGRGIQGITFDTDKKRISTIGFHSTSQWDYISGKQISSKEKRFNVIATPSTSYFDDGTRISFPVYTHSPDINTFATKNRKENLIEIWNSITRKRIGLLKKDAYKSTRGAMALIPDGGILATNDLFGLKNAVYLWDTDTNEQVAEFDIYKNVLEKVLAIFNGTAIHSMVFDYSGETLAIGTDKKEIQLWDITQDKRIRSIKTPHNYAICKLVFSPDDNFLASGDTGGDIHVWELTTGKHVAAYEGHKGNIKVLVFAKNNKFLASTGLYDGTIFLWNVPVNLTN